MAGDPSHELVARALPWLCLRPHRHNIIRRLLGNLLDQPRQLFVGEQQLVGEFVPIVRSFYSWPLVSKRTFGDFGWHAGTAQQCA